MGLNRLNGRAPATGEDGGGGLEVISKANKAMSGSCGYLSWLSIVQLNNYLL